MFPLYHPVEILFSLLFPLLDEGAIMSLLFPVGINVKLTSLVMSNSRRYSTRQSYVAGRSVTRRYSVPRYEFVGSSVKRNDVPRMSNVVHPLVFSERVKCYCIIRVSELSVSVSGQILI